MGHLACFFRSLQEIRKQNLLKSLDHFIWCLYFYKKNVHPGSGTNSKRMQQIANQACEINIKQIVFHQKWWEKTWKYDLLRLFTSLKKWAVSATLKCSIKNTSQVFIITEAFAIFFFYLCSWQPTLLCKVKFWVTMLK